MARMITKGSSPVTMATDNGASWIRAPLDIHMKYIEFRDRIERKLRRRKSGLTWTELRDELDLPYERPCPTWTKQLELEIGLTRTKGEKGRALVWRIPVGKKAFAPD